MAHRWLNRSVVIATLFQGVWISPARGHGEAGWIQHHPKFSYCCNERDCFRMARGDVREVKTGWAVRHAATEIIVPYGKELPSENEDFWACFGQSAEGVFIRCLFVPPMGA